MLEPREADLPILFLILVVLPVLTYILLGKWCDAAKKRERISVLAQIAAEESLRTEAMTVATIVPLVASSKNVHECARCFAPATTRCARCKSVRYCSGKCQIIHWRQVHKQECQQLENICFTSSPQSSSMKDSFHGRIFDENSRASPYCVYNNDNISLDNLSRPSISADNPAISSAIDVSQNSPVDKKSKEKKTSRRSDREMYGKEDGCVNNSLVESHGSGIDVMSSTACHSKETSARHKIKSNDSTSEEEMSRKIICSNSSSYVNGRSSTGADANYQDKSHQENTLNRRCREGSSLQKVENGASKPQPVSCVISSGCNLSEDGTSSNAGPDRSSNSSRVTKSGEGVKIHNGSHSLETITSKPPRTGAQASGEQCMDFDRRDENEPKGQIIAEGRNGIANKGIMKMVGSTAKKPSKLVKHNTSILNGEKQKKTKMLFPYDDFVKFFQYEVFDLLPRGLINCGNSCYANAVLQCLTSTKPLTIYLLHRSHSRACSINNWCLMCELEHHVTMLRESGAPLSPSRILSHMRSINRQIGDGSQEDAHEFLRLLVASMQAICLEGLGGEKKVDARLQETTFIQHTFGGHLRSKVKCLRCHHESERYENMMDLTLEIYGWVESLEDALTQFTAVEDLDGENMYRCGRCSTYVQARKQLKIHEAPNILTIVLKRFQGGRYGKINKCIMFPDMLDMTPYMTGTYDMPPLYILYAVVVHLDTQNASFSGHYVSYIRNLQGCWFRIDDTEVQSVPMSQVMSEEAYILFYMRSSPRPQKIIPGKAVREHGHMSERHCTTSIPKASKPMKSKSSHYLPGEELVSDRRPDYATGLMDCTSSGSLYASENGNIKPAIENYGDLFGREFSDATSSDWSLFTSSDEASFTTESTRDSFSMADYPETCNADSISSIFNTFRASEYPSPNPVSCRLFSNSKAQTKFISEEKGYVLDSYLSSQHIDRVRNGSYGTNVRSSNYAKQVSARTSSLL